MRISTSLRLETKRLGDVAVLYMPKGAYLKRV